jgi:hypothetical protein
MPPSVSPPSIKITKPLLAVLLILMLFGATALVIWGPVRSYGVNCQKADLISCEVRRETAREMNSWQLPMGPDAQAQVRLQRNRRGSPRVLLYLVSSTRQAFVAEFEGGAANENANEAAAKFNQLFASKTPATVSIEVRPPPYLRWMAWGTLAFAALMVLVVYRELFRGGE